MPRALARVSYRAGQFVRHALAHRGPSCDDELAQLLPPVQYRLVRRLSHGDRAHLLAVWHRLAARTDDADLLTAGLLHDIGKVDDQGRVYLAHRIAAVVLGHWWPGLLGRLAAPSRGGWRHGFYLAREHPRLGAELAQQAGCGERVCWLIARHADRDATDPALRLLQWADGEG